MPLKLFTKAWQASAIFRVKSDTREICDLYDERASDHQNIILDIFIGIEPKKMNAL